MQISDMILLAARPGPARRRLSPAPHGTARLDYLISGARG